MNELKGKKFVASYSSGKDSTLSIYKAIQSGMIPRNQLPSHPKTRDIHEPPHHPDQNKR